MYRIYTFGRGVDVVPELGTCLSSGPRQVSNTVDSVLDSVNSVLDWDNKNCLSSGPRQSDYLSSGLRQHKNYLSSGPRQLDCLSWGPLYKLYTIRTIIHDVLLAYHYPTKRSLNQNIFVKYSNKQRHIYLLKIEHNNSNKTIIHFARHFRITAC